jgi:hypothetical protein
MLMLVDVLNLLLEYVTKTSEGAIATLNPEELSTDNVFELSDNHSLVSSSVNLTGIKKQITSPTVTVACKKLIV